MEILFSKASGMMGVLGKLTPRKIAPPALILTLILNQTLTLTGGQFSGHH